MIRKNKTEVKEEHKTSIERGTLCLMAIPKFVGKLRSLDYVQGKFSLVKGAPALGGHKNSHR